MGLIDTVRINREARARRVRIIALRAKGETLEAIGKRFGITRERVRQILAKEMK